jgi:branched-chain amino acid transport system ATP-binding protein
MSLLEVEQVSSFYGDFQALYDVSLTVEAGETLAIIGANGAGKSTLLNIIAGLFPNGAVHPLRRAADRSIADHLRVEARISLVPEGRRVSQPDGAGEPADRSVPRRGRWNVPAVLELFPLLMARSSVPLCCRGEQQALAIGRA